MACLKSKHWVNIPLCLFLFVIIYCCKYFIFSVICLTRLCLWHLYRSQSCWWVAYRDNFFQRVCLNHDALPRQSYWSGGPTYARSTFFIEIDFCRDARRLVVFFCQLDTFPTIYNNLHPLDYTSVWCSCKL